MSTLFFSYCTQDQQRSDPYLATLKAFLNMHEGIEVVMLDQRPEWPAEALRAIDDADYFVMFLGSSLGAHQTEEIRLIAQRFAPGGRQLQGEQLILVELDDAPTAVPDELQLLAPPDAIRLTTYLEHYDTRSLSSLFDSGYRSAHPEKHSRRIVHLAECSAGQIIQRTGRRWLPRGVPHDYAFDSEKMIIDFYAGPNLRRFLEGIARDQVPGSFGTFTRDNAATLRRVLRHQVGSESRERLRQLFLRAERGEPLDAELADAAQDAEIGNCIRAFIGLPEMWSSVKKLGDPAPLRVNPVPGEDSAGGGRSAGEYRGEGAMIRVDARTRATMSEQLPPLAFPEAGPRGHHVHPRTGALHVGILVSGGIAPGINAVIEGIVSRHRQYSEASHERGNGYWLVIKGYQEGFSSLMRLHPAFIPLQSREAADKLRARRYSGGSVLHTSRAENLVGPSELSDARLEEVLRNLQDINILYVIGGDGSMRAAHRICLAAEARGMELSLVAVPKTMDNDILWDWQSFGFMSAVEEARRIVQALSREATSNPRLGVIQLFGSDSGFVVSHAALGSGVCDAVLIPEDDLTLESLSARLWDVLSRRRGPGGERTPHGILLLGETAIPRDYPEYVDKHGIKLEEAEREALQDFMANGRRVRGQTPDALREATVRIVAGVLEREVQNRLSEEGWSGGKFRVFVNQPRHIVRAVDPIVPDVIMAGRLGALAVDNAMAGYTDCMVSNWLTEYVLVPLELVVLGRKRVRRSGIFWRTVLASAHERSEGYAEPDADPW